LERRSYKLPVNKTNLSGIVQLEFGKDFDLDPIHFGCILLHIPETL
jgi:hypothetical protein